MLCCEVNLYNLRETYSLWDHEQEKHDDEHKQIKEKHIIAAEKQRMPRTYQITPHTHLPVYLYIYMWCVIVGYCKRHVTAYVYLSLGNWKHHKMRYGEALFSLHGSTLWSKSTTTLYRLW